MPAPAPQTPSPQVEVPPPERYDEDVPAPAMPTAGASVRPKSPVVYGTFEEKGDSDDDEVMVKTEFVWADGAEHDVKLSGAWNGWMPVQMYHEGGGMWSVVTPVPAGTHEFKFVVDGEWKHSTRHPTVGASEDTMNNIRVIRGPPKNKQNTARLSEQRNKQAGMSAPKPKKCCIS
ncbi:SNF1-related protein kinase regulatory subunit beta-2 [Gracilariopsis chorda]|uniref:SNF1-related protein kinase regulatory subunit beta-2 n=1 Tax=Gracilariopsis chorda TaxID=448386 RepID=A0A2V3J031_9FLOR|nr:SNF1-related protein kinase regulatory subunit beta-2 [Gracilariopsis chorda]|eukprot:PXF47287.1 SNF1-related protein kinase regulatory subunit beta-2 [Gracilariopsis chorda]